MIKQIVAVIVTVVVGAAIGDHFSTPTLPMHTQRDLTDVPVSVDPPSQKAPMVLDPVYITTTRHAHLTVERTPCRPFAPRALEQGRGEVRGFCGE